MYALTLSIVVILGFGAPAAAPIFGGASASAFGSATPASGFTFNSAAPASAFGGGSSAPAFGSSSASGMGFHAASTPEMFSQSASAFGELPLQELLAWTFTYAFTD